MTIGEKIRYYRLKEGMTQEKLASELNLSFQAISKWERGESLPDVTIVSRLSRTLNVSCDALLTDPPFFQETELQNILERFPHSLELMAVLAETYSKGTGV